jgi:hypothetical protein
MAGIINALNTFPSDNGISVHLSPESIVDGRNKMDMNVKRINFGSYAYIHTGTSNDMNTRSVPAVALRQANRDGGHYFMNLETGKRMHSYIWDEIPISGSAIATVERLAKTEKQPEIVNGDLLFEWNIGDTIGEDDPSEDDPDVIIEDDQTSDPDEIIYEHGLNRTDGLTEHDDDSTTLSEGYECDVTEDIEDEQTEDEIDDVKIKEEIISEDVVPESMIVELESEEADVKMDHNDRPSGSTRGQRDFMEMSFRGPSYDSTMNCYMSDATRINKQELQKRANHVMFTQMQEK